MHDGVPFHATIEGRRFFGLVMPEIATQLARIAKALEAIAEAQGDGAADPEPEPPPVADQPPT